MPDSVAVANIEISMQDGLQAGIPPVIFRTVPPISFKSNFQLSYNGYAKVFPGYNLHIVGTGTLPGSNECPFVYVRHAGPSGLLSLTIIGSGTLGTMNIVLNPGGVFFVGNPARADSSHNFITSVIATPAISNDYAVIVEWMAAS